MSYEVIVLDVDGIGKEAMEVNSEAEPISWIVTDIKNPYHSRNLGISRSSGSYIPYQVNPSSSSIKDQVYGVFYLQTEKNVANNYGVTAGNLVFSRALYDTVGPFDESHHSGMDIDWSQRVHAKGLKIKFNPDLKVTYPGQSWKELCTSIDKYFKGIAHQHKMAKWSLGKRIAYLSKYLMPMRPATFKQALTARPSVSSTTDKWYLWLRVWQAKLYMAKAYFRCL